LIEIIQALDQWTDTSYTDLEKKLFGYTELVRKTERGSEQVMPATINGTSNRQQVSLDDRYQLITWFR
jgi:hypothetical protein